MAQTKEELMKNLVVLNKYPDNYEEENLPEVRVEIRYNNSGPFNQQDATLLANKLSELLDGVRVDLLAPGGK